MQYLLTEDEYKALADVDAKVKQLASEYATRLGATIIDRLSRISYHSYEFGDRQTKNIEVIREAFRDTPVIIKTTAK